MNQKMTIEQLENLSTKRLMSLRNAIYKCGFCLPHSPYDCYHPSIDEVKKVLATREHVPRKGK